MPADRTKSFKYTDAGQYSLCHILLHPVDPRTHYVGNEALWAPRLDQEFMSSSAVSFMANVTAFDFSSDMPPPLVEIPPSEHILFPPTEPIAAPKRQPHSRKKPENHIPRPPNAFILFRSSFIKSQHVSTEVETNHSTLSKIIGITWQSLPDQERQIWHQKAKEALEEHKRRFPKYAFRPVQTKAKGASSEKRKVREVEPKDLKRCEKIAQLLVEGKKGQALENAIQEFDKHHVPEIVTRFEAPITARSYRRSSSAPIPDTENARAQKSFLQTVSDAPKRKFRAASTRPTRCSSPVPLHNCTPPVDSVIEQSPLLKEEAAFVSCTTILHPSPSLIHVIKQNFDSFSFDNIASPIPAYDCDPLGPMDMASFEQGQLQPPLTVDTNFMSVNNWSPSPSPMTPVTPSYFLANGSEPLESSPLQSFASFDGFDHVSLEKSFGDFAATFPPTVDQACAISQPQDQHCGAGAGVLFPFNQPQMLGNIDLDFFMHSIPAM